MSRNILRKSVENDRLTIISYRKMSELAQHITSSVRAALREDVGDGDCTAALLEPVAASAYIVSRQRAVLCGCAWFDETFRQVDGDTLIQWHYADGEQIADGAVLCEIRGAISALLTAERTALNFLQTLSATATETAEYVRAIEHTDCKLLDTRKTIPGLRAAQKYAVSCGGGVNHRAGLYDAILIKENHIRAAASIREVVAKARAMYPDVFVEVEVENMRQLEQALDSAPDRILLDNFSVTQLATACTLNSGRCALEASGNITLENIAAMAATGVDFISVGDITKNIRAVDFSMQVLVR